MADYEHVRVEELPDAPNPTDHKWEVDEAVGANEFGFNVYEARPGQQLPWGFHSHPNHEELLYVLSGRIRIETLEDEIEVVEGEAFFVPAGVKQRARATGNSPARVIAVGAPKRRDDSVIEAACPNCGERTDRDYEVREDGEEVSYQLFCAECGAETSVLRPGPE